MQEVGIDASYFLGFTQIYHKSCILAFPAYPAFHKGSTAKQTVGQGCFTDFYILAFRIYQISDSGTQSQILFSTWHIALTIKFAIIQCTVITFINSRIIKMLSLFLKIIQFLSHFIKIFFLLCTKKFQFWIKQGKTGTANTVQSYRIIGYRCFGFIEKNFITFHQNRIQHTFFMRYRRVVNPQTMTTSPQSTLN